MSARALALVGAALLITGCAMGPPPLPEVASHVPAPATVSTGDPAMPWPEQRWWLEYHDATLTALIDRALANAPGIASAAARFGSAREDLRVAGAAIGMRIDVEGAFRYQRLSENGLFPPQVLGFSLYGQTDLGVRMRYDFDWWGRKRATIEAAGDRALASGAESQSAAIALSAAVAETYFGWQADAARIALLDERLATLDRTARIATQRQAAGLETRDDTERNRQEQALARELRAQLSGSQDLRRVLIAALLGTPQDTVPAFEARALPQISAQIPATAGLDLVARRPDVAASRWRIEAARQDLDVVRADYYPDVSIDALAGLQSITRNQLFTGASGVPALGVALHLPLYDGGMRDARHGVATAQLTEAIAAYNEAVVDAAREVGSAAANLVQAGQQRRERAALLESSDALLRSAEARTQAGLTDARPALAARLELLRERDLQIQIEHAALVADIQLKEALGGGFRDTVEP